MTKPSIAELLRASGHMTFTPDLVNRAVETLYGDIGAGLDGRDWDNILAADNALLAAEEALVVMYNDTDFLVRNANHLAGDYGAAQIEYTYRGIFDRLDITGANDWAAGMAYEDVAQLDESRLESEAGSEYEARRPEPDNGGGNNGGGGGGGDETIIIEAAGALLSPTEARDATATTTDENDTIEIATAFFAGTTIDGGGGGNNTLEITDGGAFELNGNDITNVRSINLNDAGNSVTRSGGGEFRIVGGTGDDTVIYDTFGEMFSTGDPARMEDELADEGGTNDTIQVNDAISYQAGDLNFNKATGFERLVQENAGEANITFFGGDRSLREVDISDSTGNSTVDASDLTSAIRVESGSGNDTLSGGSQADNIGGGDGNDTITGGAGADSLTGGAGADTLTGGAGEDQYNIDAGADDITDFGVGVDKVDITAGATLAAAVTADYTAGAAGDIDNAAAAADAVFTVADDVNFDASAATDTTNGITVTAADNAAASALVGTDQDDVITGGAGNDTIDGSAGADIITGGAGADDLTGGGGADEFVLSDLVTGAGAVESDTITDFTAAQNDQAGNISVGDIADLVTLTDVEAATTDVADGDSVSVATGNIGAAFDLGGVAAGTNLLIATGNYADAAAVQVDLRANGIAGTRTSRDEGFLIAYDDGTDSYIAAVDYNALEAANDRLEDAVVTNLVELTGVADATTLTNGSFLDFTA